METFLTTRYFVRISDQVSGPFAVTELHKVPGFVLATPVCAEGSKTWAPAFEVIDLKAYFTRQKSAETIIRPFEQRGIFDLILDPDTNTYK